GGVRTQRASTTARPPGQLQPTREAVGNESEPVVVSFGITLQQIIDVVGYPAA
ncbi:hypothetical protein Pmani_035558, partial [Petrolisthes manimaculis]